MYKEAFKKHFEVKKAIITKMYDGCLKILNDSKTDEETRKYLKIAHENISLLFYLYQTNEDLRSSNYYSLVQELECQKLTSIDIALNSLKDIDHFDIRKVYENLIQLNNLHNQSKFQ